jgi:hypothetical protein
MKKIILGALIGATLVICGFAFFGSKHVEETAIGQGTESGMYYYDVKIDSQNYILVRESFEAGAPFTFTKK